MSNTQNGEAFEPITVHNFSERILEQLVHFHVMKLNGGFFLWVGSSPVLSNLAVSMCSKYDSMPISTLVMGDPSNITPNSLAQRLDANRVSSPLHKMICKPPEIKEDQKASICELQSSSDGIQPQSSGGRPDQKGVGASP
ncbi:proteasome assembly chaperone 4 isoform X1 [Pseudoliparis swirei]|uniref:proteasome assembly chaperone 4 isoform X1 n=1 Tax=Pseudoliparis swirei TaxID=2059687 RepID=UPI0024BEF05E|nr:proteasome assembly chaperone 4 isoform X1 [Pseudoliparis swirei]